MDSTKYTNEIKARKFIDKHASEAVEMVVFALSKVLTPLLYCIPLLNNSAHAVYAIASPFRIPEMKKCRHNKHRVLCKCLFLRKTFAKYGYLRTAHVAVHLAYTMQPSWQ